MEPQRHGFAARLRREPQSNAQPNGDTELGIRERSLGFCAAVVKRDPRTRVGIRWCLMHTTTYGDPQAFLDRASSFLATQEAANNLILGVSADLAGNPRDDEAPPFFATAEDDGMVVAACLRTPPHPLSLALAVPEVQDSALAALVDIILLQFPDLPAISGPSTVVEPCARLIAERTGRVMQIKLAMRIYQLIEVQAPHEVPGALCRATESDIELIATWLGEFDHEALGAPDVTPHLAAAQRWVRAPNRGIYLWEDAGQTVSMAGYSGPTIHGIRINSVYTPPGLRGRGYASACVAALSQLQLDNGRRFCFLFTDLRNPTSNKIYQRIGYTPVCDATEIAFV